MVLCQYKGSPISLITCLLVSSGIRKRITINEHTNKTKIDIRPTSRAICDNPEKMSIKIKRKKTNRKIAFDCLEAEEWIKSEDIDGFYNNTVNIMRPTTIKLIWRGMGSFNLVEFILPILNILLGLGIARKTAGFINIGHSAKFILFIIFLEIGSQLFQFYKNEFINSANRKKDEKERGAILMLVILFYALCLLPFSQLFLSQQNNFSFLIISAITAFFSIIWRNFGDGAIPKFISKIFFILNNAFFLPLSQLSLFGVKINQVYISIFQFLFLFLFTFLFMREIFRIEILNKKSSIVKLVGTIPILRISVIMLLIGCILFTLFAFRQSVTELGIAALGLSGLLIPVFKTSISPLRYGKKGLITSYRLTQLIGAGIYLGLFYFLWMN